MQMVEGVTEGELIARSASGDRAAQAAMVSLCIAKQFGTTVTPFECAAFAEVFARQAAAHGFLDDRLHLSAVLRIRAHHLAVLGDVERSRRLLSEGIAAAGDLSGIALSDAVEFLAGVLTSQAEMGSEEAEALLDRITSSLTAAEADTLRNNINRAARELAAEEMEVAHG